MSTTLAIGKPWQILQGDVRRVARDLPSNYFHAFLSDPPYGISFMGRRWDYNVPSAMVWNEIERTLIPGGHGMIFGGPRTFHRVAIAVEDGGFEMRDLIMWLFGEAMPKSLNVSKALDKAAGATRKVVGRRTTGAGNGSVVGLGSKRSMETSFDVTVPATLIAKRWDGSGTGLKPGYEPVILARKMTEATIAENVRLWGAGGLDINASRIGGESTRRTNAAEMGYHGGNTQSQYETGSDLGRWPANVILDEEAAAMLDEQSGNRRGMSSGGVHREGYAGGMFGGINSSSTARGDAGGASRFFYTAKADRYQRDAGLDALPDRAPVHGANGAGGGLSISAAVNAMKNDHPTVKPIDLIRYLAKLILPPYSGEPRRILVPFSGSGSEMIGCIQAGWDEVVGIEREAEYIAFASARIKGGGVFSGLMDKKMRRRKASTRR